MGNSFDSKEVSVVDNTTYITLTIGSVSVDVSTGVGPSIDSTLENNSWSTIRSVCEAGDAANYWSVGDEKTDVGTDGYTRTFRIVDMQGLYNKHVVFEQVEVERVEGIAAAGLPWDTNQTQTDYSLSTINTVTLPNIETRYSNDLQASLTNTTVSYLTSVDAPITATATNKLFLEAATEVGIDSNTSSLPLENTVLSVYSYWSVHTTAEDRTKKKMIENNNFGWWLRTYCNSSSLQYCINTSGSFYADNRDSVYWKSVAPCFSF